MSVYYKETADNLKKSLDSIYNQTVPCNEIVLVEDGPLTDELYKVSFGAKGRKRTRQRRICRCVRGGKIYSHDRAVPPS